MRKIIHLSDLHVGYKDLGRRFHCLAAEIEFLKEPASDYVIVITGDLVESAHRDESFGEVKAQIDRLSAVGFRVLVIPGNHDYGTGWLGDKKFIDRFKQVFYANSGITYPKLDLLGGTAFIGLDTMAEELHWYDTLFAEGELGDPQLGRLAAILDSQAVRDADHRVVYMHHHPFDARPNHELKDARRLGEVLRGRGVSALLYGHNHEARIANGKWDIRRCYDAGTSTRKDDRPGPVRVIDLSREARLDYPLDVRCGRDS